MSNSAPKMNFFILSILYLSHIFTDYSVDSSKPNIVSCYDSDLLSIFLESVRLAVIHVCEDKYVQ